MSNWVYGIIIGVLFLAGSHMVYKTFELRAMVKGMTVDVIKLQLATEELTCDIEQVHAYELGHKQGLEDASSE